MRRFLWRLSRLLGVAVALVMAVGLFAAAGYAIAPHAGKALTAVDMQRAEVDFDLTPGAQRTEVYDRYGNQIGVLNTAVDREIVSYDQIPQDVIDAVLAVEDEKFFEHHGFDLRGTIRAMLSNVSAGEVTGGGSTITQQIVKLRVVGNERTFNRKIREAILASRLEEQMTKEELLEFYLNEIYFGNGAYGIQAAAETYFGKDVEELDHGDAALLAGLIRAPSVFDGFEDFDVARKRRTVGLTRMLELGIITQDEFDEYQRRPLPTRNLSPRFTNKNLKRDYFFDTVTEALLNLDALGDTREERFNAVYSGGLRVYSTFDPVLERQMKEAVKEVLPDGTGRFEVSIATVEPSTGAVRAFLGGPDFAEFEFNLATQGKRQPGSSFKTYVLTTAIERAGILPYDTISGIGPCAFDDGPKLYIVNNFSRSPGTVKTIRGQTLSSSNCAFVRLGIVTGLEDVADLASQMVGRSEDERFLPFKSMSLGAQEVTPLEHAVGYSVLANDGIRMEPYYVERIEDREGNVIYEHIPRGRRLVSSETARWVTSVLEANVRGGTGRRAQLANGQPAAGKTGTAQDFTDAWFVGYTPQYATSVWLGDPLEKVEMRNVLGHPGGVTGGSIPATIWGVYMSKALADTPIQPFDPPPPAPRAGRFLFLPDEKCPVEIELADGTKLEFKLDCRDVNVDMATRNGKFVPRDSALCEITITDEEGISRREKVRCSEVADRLNPTTTTTTTEDPSSTTVPGDTTTTAPGETTTTAPGGGGTTTVPTTTTTPPDSSTTTSTTTTTGPPSSTTTSTTAATTTTSSSTTTTP